MSSHYSPYTLTDNMSDKSSFSFADTECKRRYHALKGTNYSASSQASQATGATSSQFRSDVFPSTNWPADASTQTQRPATAAQSEFDSSPFRLPPTLHGSSISSHPSDNSPLRFGCNTSSAVHHSIVQHHPQTVAMPTLTERYGYNASLIDAHACYYDPPSNFVHDDYMAGYPRAVPSPAITMPIPPTYLRTGAPSHMNSILPSDTALRWSPRYRTTPYSYVPPPGSPLSPSPPGSFDSGSYSSSSSPCSPDDHSLVTAPFDTSDHIQPQSIITASIDPLYTLRVLLEAVKFPPLPNVGDPSFFRCCWEGCDNWITSEKDAVKDHLTRTHRVVLKGKADDAAHCKWASCASSLQKCGLVRHFQTHLDLQWLCSVCKVAFTRRDSVRAHAARERRCNLAQAISYPSPLAYRVTEIHHNNTVTLIKILQP
ncbi:hypothetical protein V8E55_009261 [Tylopilus felleus]